MRDYLNVAKDEILHAIALQLFEEMIEERPIRIDRFYRFTSLKNKYRLYKQLKLFKNISTVFINKYSFHCENQEKYSTENNRKQKND